MLSEQEEDIFDGECSATVAIMGVRESFPISEDVQVINHLQRCTWCPPMVLQGTRYRQRKGKASHGTRDQLLPLTRLALTLCDLKLLVGRPGCMDSIGQLNKMRHIEANRFPNAQGVIRSWTPDHTSLLMTGPMFCSPSVLCVKSLQLCQTLCDPHGLQPARLLGPWVSPGKKLEWVAMF